MRYAMWAVVVAVFAYVVFCVFAVADSVYRKAHYLDAELIGVIDGDTIVVTMDGREGQQTIQLTGIQAPELYPKGGGEPEAYAKEARNSLSDLLRGDKDHDVRIEVKLDEDEKDQYGRVLGYVWVHYTTRPLATRNELTNRIKDWGREDQMRAIEEWRRRLKEKETPLDFYACANDWMVNQGLARAVYESPNDRRKRWIEEAEERAKEAKLGIWSE